MTSAGRTSARSGAGYVRRTVSQRLRSRLRHLRCALIEDVVMLNEGGRDDPEVAAREPKTVRQVDVVKVEEEVIWKSDRLPRQTSRRTARRAPERKPGAIRLLRERADGSVEAADPAEPKEMRLASCGVDALAGRGG